MPESLVGGSVVSLLLLLAVPARAQDAPAAPPERAPESGEAASEEPWNAVEFGLGGDGLTFDWRNAFHRGAGYATIGFFAGEDDDLALYGRLLRFAEPSTETPLGFGIGLGVFAAAFDDEDDEVGAVTLTGAVDFALDRAFDLAYPIRIGVEGSWAPDIATFADGERVIDVLGRVEADLSTWATVFVGYRHLEVDLEDEEDQELDSALQAGIRLGF